MKSLSARNVPLRPPNALFPPSISVKRSEISTFELNPFSFYVNYNGKEKQHVDDEVQKIGNLLCKDEFAQEPQQWALVFSENRWFRAEVLAKYYNSCEECTGAEVSLVDTGCRKVANIGEIFPIQPEVLRLGPVQCVRIFPSNVSSAATRLLNVLFDEYPDMKFQIQFKTPLSPSCLRSPHLVGTFAEILVGYRDWLPLEELLLRFKRRVVRERRSMIKKREDSDSRETSESEEERPSHGSRAGSSESDSISGPDVERKSRKQRSESAKHRNRLESNPGFERGMKHPLKVEPSSTARSNLAISVHSEQDDDSFQSAESNSEAPAEQRLNSDLGGSTRAVQISYGFSHGHLATQEENCSLVNVSDAYSSHEAKNELCNKPSESVANISYQQGRGNAMREYSDPPGDAPSRQHQLEGERAMERSNEIINKKAKKNAKPARICWYYRMKGECAQESLCPFSHDLSAGSASTAAGTTIAFRDFTEVNLPEHQFNQHFFAVCTHVDHTGKVYLVLPYGPNTIRHVLGNKPLDLALPKLTRLLSDLYDPIRGKPPGSLNYAEHTAVAWIEEDGSGSLGNIMRGWYRVKILQRKEASCEVFLVDHGAQLWVELKTLYPLRSEKLFHFEQQSLPCYIQDTELPTSEGLTDREMYEALKMRILVFRVYEKNQSEGFYAVDIFSQTDAVSIHYGEYFVEKQILKWKTESA